MLFTIKNQIGVYLVRYNNQVVLDTDFTKFEEFLLAPNLSTGLWGLDRISILAPCEVAFQANRNLKVYSPLFSTKGLKASSLPLPVTVVKNGR